MESPTSPLDVFGAEGLVLAVEESDSRSFWLLFTLNVIGSLDGSKGPFMGMERMFSMMCSMICWPRMVHWFVRFIGQSFGGTTNFSSSCNIRHNGQAQVERRIPFFLHNVGTFCNQLIGHSFVV